MAQINRKSYSATIEPAKQPGYSKVIVANITPTGYMHIVAVRTTFVNEKPVDSFTDVLIHPDRAGSVDIQKFDAVTFLGTSPRNAPGQAKEHTQYLWANGAQPFGKHLVSRNENNELVYAGIGIYALAEGTPEPLDPASELPKG